MEPWVLSLPYTSLGRVTPPQAVVIVQGGCGQPPRVPLSHVGIVQQNILLLHEVLAFVLSPVIPVISPAIPVQLYLGPLRPLIQLLNVCLQPWFCPTVGHREEHL